jgi:hypothetical protein
VPPKRTPTPDTPVVYTIQGENGGPVKIGYCDRRDGVPSRLGGIQTGNPDRLVIRRIVDAPNGRADERAMHDRLAKYRLAGEWFTCAPEVAIATGALLPGKRDLVRELLPIIEAAHEAGKRVGRIEAEAVMRSTLRMYFDGFHDLIAADEDTLDPDDDVSALLLASVRKFGVKRAA